MNKLKVKTKIIDQSIVMRKLQYTKDGDAGIDLVATSKLIDNDGNVVYGTNRAFEIPKGHVGLLFPRSSNSKKDLILSNSVGIIDSGYRGEVMMKYKPTNFSYTLMTLINLFLKKKGGIVVNMYVNYLKSYEIGERVGQLVIIPYPEIEFEEVDELSDSERGSGGYGSTGK